jgi:hypothetical protein
MKVVLCEQIGETAQTRGAIILSSLQFLLFNLLKFYFLRLHEVSMFWLNINRPTGAWKLHKESCRFCNPRETRNKGLNELKQNGGWIQVESYESATVYFDKKHNHNEYWQPCKECRPKI